MTQAPSRYGIYLIPDPEAPLFQRASQWLGWDCVAGRVAPTPPESLLGDLRGLDTGQLVSPARKYGFHGTIKPPFRLAEGMREDMLVARAMEVAASVEPVIIEELHIASLGDFLALVPDAPSKALGELAAEMVTGLDDFRRPADEAELARRRAAGLSQRQEELLAAWGYPYVLDEFRFHMTLSGRLAPDIRDRVRDMLARLIGPTLPKPFMIDRLALVGEGPDGMFRMICWIPLADRRPVL